MASPRGYVYVHRANLHDKIGPGSHLCHWCGTQVSWEGDASPLTADHLDWDKENNAEANLVPSCLPCNSRRYQTRDDRGSSNPAAKLTEADVLAIRASEDLHRLIADQFGVSESLVSMIRSGKVWKG